MNKTCRVCKETKDESEFAIANSGKSNVSFRHREFSRRAECKSCTADYAKEWRKKNKAYKGSGKLNSISKEDKLLYSAIGSRLIDARSRIKRSNQQPTDLDKDYLMELFKQQKGKCALSGNILTLQQNRLDTLSLDKINPNKGYIKGNVQWLCWAVNRAKGEMNTNMFLKMCAIITERCNDYPEKEYSSSELEAQSP